MAEKATNRDKICEDFGQWLELRTKTLGVALTFVGSEEQVRSISSRSGVVASSTFSENFEVHIGLGSHITVKQS